MTTENSFWRNYCPDFTTELALSYRCLHGAANCALYCFAARWRHHRRRPLRSGTVSTRAIPMQYVRFCLPRLLPNNGTTAVVDARNYLRTFYALWMQAAKYRLGSKLHAVQELRIKYKEKMGLFMIVLIFEFPAIANVTITVLEEIIDWTVIFL